MKRSEEGAALLSVLLLVAVIAVLAAASLQKLKLATHLAQNGIAIDQARAYALAAESLALYRISDLVQRNSSKTTLQGGWAGRDVAFPIDGGIASARLSDAGNCFNLNSLVENPTEAGTVVRPVAVAQFERLLVLADTAPADAKTVAVAAADWIDTDSSPLPGGAEDTTYAGGSTPYRTANTLMADPSELRAVAGVTPALYSRVRPYLCALPVTQLSPINVNTLLPEQAPLLAMLVPGLDIGRARAIIESRPANGFESRTEFWSRPGLAGVPGDEQQQVQLKTRWFGLKLLIELGGAELEENALIDGALQPARLVRRAYGDSA